MTNTAKLSPTSYAILGLLAREPQSAYELNKLMQTSLIRVFWPRAESHVYSEPKKLLANDLVSQRKEKIDGRPRTVYTITKLGRESLQQWLKSNENPELRMQSELMLKLILADAGSVEDTKATLVQSFQASQDDLQLSAQGIQAILEDENISGVGMPYNGIGVELMVDVLIARLKWSSFALKAVAEINDNSSPAQKKTAGLDAYANALKKIEQALADSG